MRKIFVPCIIGIALCCLQQQAGAQQSKEHISKEFTLTNAARTTVTLYNITGSISVEGYSGDKVMIEADKTLSAANENKLSSAKNDFRLTFNQTSDSIIGYVSAPYDSRPGNSQDSQNYKPVDYEFNVNFTVKVPFAVSIDVFTINAGDIRVKDVAGKLRVRNVNGDVIITNGKGITEAQTVDGDLVIDYLENPPGGSSYSTLEGDIRVRYAAGLSADLQLKSMSGEFFSDFPVTELSQVKVTTESSGNNNEVVHKLEKMKAVRIGTGGKIFNFHTMNGNIHVMKQSN